jgi:hypothetical protein
MKVARAFQPEICPLRLAACRLRLRGGKAAGGLTRSREDAKGDARGRCSVFGQASRGRESAGAGALRSSGFPARDLPSATGCLQVAAAGRGGSGWAHAKPLSREDAKEQAHGGEGTGVTYCPALLSTFSSLLSMAWMPSPLTPDPSPPFHGGEGRIGGVPRTGVRGCRGSL